MRTDANRIGLCAIRAILEAAHSFELQVAETKVTCDISKGPPEPWPAYSLEGLEPAADGEWPNPIDVTCNWDGGSCMLRVACGHWGESRSRYRHQVGLGINLAGRNQTLLWITVPAAIADTEDGGKAQIQGSVTTFKRKSEAAPKRAQVLNSALRRLLADSKLPVVTASMAAVCEVEVPSGTVAPNADVVFRRLVHLALLKLDFAARGPGSEERGRPLIDITAYVGNMDLDDDEGGDGDEEGEQPPDRERRYWAGGFLWGVTSKLSEFLDGAYWQIGWSKTAEEVPAQVAWSRFSEIRPGDYFAIKGYGGLHDLVVHYVGEVVTVDEDAGRVQLKRLDIPLYRGRAPRGRGAGNWFDTLVPVKRTDVIEQLFGVATQTAAPPIPPRLDLPLNLILYGPPGTGKTYRILSEIAPRFIRQPAQSQSADVLMEFAASLKWYQVIALVLQARGGQAKVDDLLTHALLKAKYAVQSIPTSLRQMVWGTLGQHAVDASNTVKMKRRIGELLFDKKEDGTWFLAEQLPEDLEEASKRLRDPLSSSALQDYMFVTFHQAYGYEDFIEGIRPRVATDGDDDSELRYELEDGVFKRAVRAALRLAGYEGTLDDFCRLTKAEHARYLDGAQPYAVFIDEINRGNVARVLGELITLLEPDKRLGEEHELVITLPYSRTLFGVPNNLYVIGAMNTADRSVEALDAALRRRFEFEELIPRPDLLKFSIEGQIDPARLLRTINRRLEKIHDRDHCIGHAYFMGLEDQPTLEALKRVFKCEVIPLLKEYFFGDWGKIGLVLGRDFVRRREPGSVELADFDHDDIEFLAERTMWEMVNVDDLSSLAFRRIYEHVTEDA